MLRLTVLTLVAVLALPLAVACGGDSDDSPAPAATSVPATSVAASPTVAATAVPPATPSPPSPTATTPATAAATPDQSRTVEDASGEMVTLEAPAVRVVCLTGLCVDTMFVLGIKPVAAYDLLHLDEAYWGPDENEIGAVSGSLQLAENAIWKELRAVQNGEVYEVDFFIWGTSRGIRGTNVVLDEAMPKIYPELFQVPLP